MNLLFNLRLFCLCAASFFLVNLALGLVIFLLAPVAVRIGERMNPRSAGGFLLAARLLPAAAALAVVGLVAGGYGQMEPRFTAEYVGAVCLIAALLGVAVCATAIARTVRASVKAFSYIRRCERVGERTCLSYEAMPVVVIEEPVVLFALAGIIHPRLVVSRPAILGLSHDQLAAAVRHEQAHRTAHDNLKRLLLLLAPDILPFIRTFGPLERGWARAAEWAADDGAAAGSSVCSLSLAEALVRIARMGIVPDLAPLSLPLLEHTQDLSDRVDRLLNAQRRFEPAKPEATLLLTVVLAALTVWLARVSAQPAARHYLHKALEILHQTL